MLYHSLLSLSFFQGSFLTLLLQFLILGHFSELFNMWNKSFIASSIFVALYLFASGLKFQQTAWKSEESKYLTLLFLMKANRLDTYQGRKHHFDHPV